MLYGDICLAENIDNTYWCYNIEWNESKQKPSLHSPPKRVVIKELTYKGKGNAIDTTRIAVCNTFKSGKANIYNIEYDGWKPKKYYDSYYDCVIDYNAAIDVLMQNRLQWLQQQKEFAESYLSKKIKL